MAVKIPANRAHENEVVAANRTSGLWLGLISGLAFGLATWGVDAMALQSASVGTPWVKLALGLMVSLVLGGIAGWITALIDEAAAGLLVWGLTGVAYAWLAGHLPFEGLSGLFRLIEPQLGEVAVYPFVESARVRTILLMFIVGGLSALAGALELVLLDQARDASTGMARSFAISLSIPFFALAGFASDAVINRPLRDPIVAVSRLIGWSIEAKHTPIDPVLALQRHLGAAGGIEDLIERPYRITLGTYDDTSLMSFNIELDFEGTWARCSVLATQPGYCRKTDALYQEAIACLAESRQGSGCSVGVADSALPWIHQASLRSDAPATITVLKHIAAVVLVEVTWPDGQHDLCTFEGAQPITLTRCMSSAGN